MADLDKKIEDENMFEGLPTEVMQKLPPARTRCIMLWLTGQYKTSQIAEIVGVHDGTIKKWLRDENVQIAIKELQKREFEVIDSRLKAMRYKALDTLSDLLDSDIDQVRFQATKDVLDRTGHKPVTEMKVDNKITIEQQLKNLADIVIDDSEVIDISDLVEEAKDGG